MKYSLILFITEETYRRFMLLHGLHNVSHNNVRKCKKIAISIATKCSQETIL